MSIFLPLFIHERKPTLNENVCSISKPLIVYKVSKALKPKIT